MGFIPVTPQSPGRRQSGFRLGSQAVLPEPAAFSIFTRTIPEPFRRLKAPSPGAIVPRMNRTNLVSALRARPVALLAALIIFASLGNVLLVGCGGSGGSGSDSTANSGGADGGSDGGMTGGSDGGADGETAGGPADGAKIYADRCALCHGPGGKGDGPASAALNPKPRNHTDGAYMNAQTDEALMEVIRNGKGVMPPWGSVLSDEEIKAVLEHVRSLAVPPYSG